MSELEKAKAALADEQSKRAELEKRVQTGELKSDVRAAAVKAKAIDPEVVWRMIDEDKVERDTDGNPTNLDKLVEAIKASHPVLFTRVRGGGDGGSRGSAQGGGDMNELLRRAAGRST